MPRTSGPRARLVILVIAALFTGVSATPASVFGASPITYWWTTSYSFDNQYATAYATWTFYKINGSSTNVFVVVQRTAQAKNPYSLLRFEPWLQRSSGPSQLGNWDPDTVTTVNDGQRIGLSLSWSGATISTSFFASSQSYYPYARRDMYSLEWRGNKHQNDGAVANRQVQRWNNFSASGMYLAICGRALYYAIRTEYQFGACGNRSR